MLGSVATSTMLALRSREIYAEGDANPVVFAPVQNYAAIIVGRVGEYPTTDLAIWLAFAQTVAMLARHYRLPLIAGITNPLVDGSVQGEVAVGLLAAHVREASSWEKGSAVFRARDVFQYDESMVPEHLYTVAQMFGVVFKPQPLTGDFLCPVGWSLARLFLGNHRALAAFGEGATKIQKISKSLRASLLRAGSLRLESEYI
jgi:hypothetical protein